MGIEEVEFSIDYYTQLIESIREGGYTFSTFLPDDKSDGRFYLRHDIDKSIDCALDMARLENQLGIRAHFFFLLHTPLYNIMEPETWEKVSEIQNLGHLIGLHCDERRIPNPSGDFDSDVIKDLHWLQTIFHFASPIVSFHNPSKLPMGRRPGSSYFSTYSPDYLPPVMKYISDSNRVFREGDVKERLRKQEWPRVQMLIHPIWWFDENGTAEDILERVVQERANHIDSYLRYSSHIWEQKPEKSLTIEV